MTDNEINRIVEQIEALEPQTKEIVLQYLDLLEQVQKARDE